MIDKRFILGINFAIHIYWAFLDIMRWGNA